MKAKKLLKRLGKIDGFHCEVREPSADTVDQCQSHRAIHSKDVTTLAR